MLSAEEVIEFTGHAVGGVCAFGITNSNVKIYCDLSLKRFDTVFPACGSSNSAIELSCDELFDYSGAQLWGGRMQTASDRGFRVMLRLIYK